MTEQLQRTLEGGEQLLSDIEELRETPDTMLWCETCEDWILRSRRQDHPHELVETVDDEDDEDSDPERVGSIYEITLSYTVDYRFRVAAWSEHEAKDRAEDLTLDASPTDSMLVHTRDREITDIYEDDPKIPDDWDKYGDTRLWEVYGDAAE